MMRRINYATLIMAMLVLTQCSRKPPFYMDPGYFGYDQSFLGEHVKDLVLLTQRTAINNCWFLRLYKAGYLLLQRKVAAAGVLAG